MLRHLMKVSFEKMSELPQYVDMLGSCVTEEMDEVQIREGNVEHPEGCDAGESRCRMSMGSRGSAWKTGTS